MDVISEVIATNHKRFTSLHYAMMTSTTSTKWSDIMSYDTYNITIDESKEVSMRVSLSNDLLAVHVEAHIGAQPILLNFFCLEHCWSIRCKAIVLHYIIFDAHYIVKLRFM